MAIVSFMGPLNSERRRAQIRKRNSPDPTTDDDRMKNLSQVSAVGTSIQAKIVYSPYLLKPTERFNVERISSMNFSSLLIILANWVRKDRFESKDNNEDFEKAQVILNRCWKLFYYGIGQSEPAARYIALSAINRVASTMSQSLLDTQTGKVSYL